MNKTRTAICLLFILIASAAHSIGIARQNPVVLPEMISARLLNGLQIHVASTPQMGEAMTIGLVLRYGSIFDSERKTGLAYLTSQMIGKATEDRTAKDIQDELAYLGATLEARCDWDGIRIMVHGQSDTYERCLWLLYQVVCEAKFNDNDFAATQGALVKRLQTAEDPRQKLHNLFDAQLFRGTTYGRSLLGSIASIQGITAGDVRFFYHKFFSPDQAALAVAGSAPSSQILQKASRLWGVWVRLDEVPFTFKQPISPAGRNIFIEDDPTSPSAQYILGNLWPQRQDPSFYAASLAARILQDRLSQSFPTSRLTIGHEERRQKGPFYIQGQAAVDQAAVEIASILEAVETFKNSEPDPSELARVQNLWISEFNKSAGSVSGICELLLDAELYRLGSNYMAVFPDAIRRSNPSLIKEAAKECLFPGGSVIIVRGPAAVLRSQLESLGRVQLIVP
jgi:zinc protease